MWSSRRKSWNTTPIRRRISGSSWREMRERSLPKTVISPRVGFSDRNSSLSSVVLPAPDGPLRNWNEPVGNMEGDVAEDLRTHSISQADILEADHL